MMRCGATGDLVERLERAEDDMWTNVERNHDLMKELAQIPVNSFELGKQQADAIERVINGLKRKIAMFRWQYRELLELISSSAVQNTCEKAHAELEGPLQNTDFAEDESCRQTFV